MRRDTVRAHNSQEHMRRPRRRAGGGAEENNARQFPNFGNWLAGGAVSEPMLETLAG